MKETNVKAISDLLEMEFYRFKRYKIPVCLIVLEIEDGLFDKITEKILRKTDLFKHLEDNIYAIVYTHAHMDDARNAFFHVYNELDEQSKVKKLGIGELLISDENEYEFAKRVCENLTLLE